MLAALALPPHGRPQRRAIGIEHVGVSDADVHRPPAQLAASLRLTRWLQGRFGILTRDVIGHAESLSSPYHHERVARDAHRTHGDFAAAHDAPLPRAAVSAGLA